MSNSVIWMIISSVQWWLQSEEIILFDEEMKIPRIFSFLTDNIPLQDCLQSSW